MPLECKILQPDDRESIIELEKRRLTKGDESDPMEVEMATWHAPWRKESLDHYLPLGWSYGLWRDSLLQAYFLGQPQLFLRGLTQSLWLEHLSFSCDDEAKQLLDIAYRLCREKHFQTLLVPDEAWVQHLPTQASSQPWQKPYLQVKTAKF